MELIDFIHRSKKILYIIAVYRIADKSYEHNPNQWLTNRIGPITNKWMFISMNSDHNDHEEKVDNPQDISFKKAHQ